MSALLRGITVLSGASEANANGKQFLGSPADRSRPGAASIESVAGDVATVDIEDGSGHKIALGQQQRRVRNLVRFTDPRQQMQTAQAVFVLNAIARMHGRTNDAGGDGIEPNVLRPELGGELAGQGVYRAFAADRSRGGDTAKGVIDKHCADIDDRSAACSA